MGREAGGKERERLPRGIPRKLGGSFLSLLTLPPSFRPFARPGPPWKCSSQSLLTTSSFRASSELAL